MVKGGFGSNRKLDGWVGWLVVFYTFLVSRSTEKRELKGAYILLLLIIKKKTPARTFNKRAISALQEELVIMYTANKTEQNPQKIRYGAMHKVMIGFVFPIGK